MTVADIAEFACETTGDISSEALDFAKRTIRLKYATLYDAHNWRESMRVVDGLILDPTLGGRFFLPFDAEEVIFCSMSYDQRGYVRLTYRERDWIERFATPTFNLPGNTPWFYRAENLAWPSLNPGKFTFTTTEKSPFTVYISGRDADDFPISETFSLQGIINADNTVTASSITTQHSYNLVTGLSKNATDQALTIGVQNPAGFVQVLAPAVTELVYSQFVLYPEPIFQAADGTPLTVYIRLNVKLKPDSLDNDMSVPRISHIWDALLSFTTAALWKRMHQVAKSQADNQDAMAHVQAAINVEKNQSEFHQQAVPVRYETSDYLDDESVYRATSYNPFGM